MKSQDWKGEFTVVVEGAKPQTGPDYFEPDEVVEEARELIRGGMQKKKAFRLLADRYKTSRRAIYTIYLEAEENSEDIENDARERRHLY